MNSDSVTALTHQLLNEHHISVLEIINIPTKECFVLIQIFRHF